MIGAGIVVGTLVLAFFFVERSEVRVGRSESAATFAEIRTNYSYPVQRLQIQVEVVDEGNHITHETIASVNDVPPGGRGLFRVQLPAAGARYIVTVRSFEFGAGQSP